MSVLDSTLRPCGLGVLLAIVIVALPPTNVRADSWYDCYDRGETALREKHWEDAVRELSQAIKLKGDPGISVRTYGTNLIDYTPYLKLGVAYLELGNPSATLQALATEEQLGAIAKSKTSMAILLQTRSRAQAAQAESVAKLRESSVARIADAIAESKELEGKGRPDEALAALAPAMALASQQRLRDRLAKAEQSRGWDQMSARFVDEGKAHLKAGRLQEASSAFSNALWISPNADVEALLQTSQYRLREQVIAKTAAEGREALVAVSLETASKLEAS